MRIEEILSQLAIRAAHRFNLSTREAVSAVACSKLGNEIASNGNPSGLGIEELTERLFAEIRTAGQGGASGRQC